MTKKAEKLISKFEEKAINHIDFYKRHKREIETLTYKWTCDYLTDMYNEFRTMLLGMYRFEVLSENDMEETVHLSNNIYNMCCDKLMSYR